MLARRKDTKCKVEEKAREKVKRANLEMVKEAKDKAKKAAAVVKCANQCSECIGPLEQRFVCEHWQCSVFTHCWNCGESTPRPGATAEYCEPIVAINNGVAAKAAALAAKAAAKASSKAKRAEGQARIKREQALNAIMATAAMDAVVRGRVAASAEKQARVKADVAKHNQKRKRQWSAEKQRKEQARASPAHARDPSTPGQRPAPRHGPTLLGPGYGPHHPCPARDTGPTTPARPGTRAPPPHLGPAHRAGPSNYRLKYICVSSMHMYMYKSMHVYMYMYIYMYKIMHVYIYMYMYMYRCICIDVYV
jgi:hypothetical protein